MQDLPRHLGQHSGGMVICQGELSSVVPLENASMPGRVVVQWDKDDCADMGLIKVDLLGLGMMAVLQDAIRLVNGGHRARAQVHRAREGKCGGHRPDGIRHPADGTGTAQHADRSRPPAARRRGVSHAAGGRHDWRVSGRVARADGDAAAAETDVLLRSRRAGGDHPSRADRRADGASVSQSPRGPRSRWSTTIRCSSRC